MEEQELRREAMRRYVLGERPSDICRALDRTTRWFRKWHAVYQAEPHGDLADRSRAPGSSPQAVPDAIRAAMVATRARLEAQRARGDYGLIEAGAVRDELEPLKVTPLPSLSTIQRVLHAAGLTHPLGAGRDQAYYPWLTAWDVNAIQATDLIVRHLRGQAEVDPFHTIDHYSHAVCLTQHLDKSSTTACAHLKRAWKTLGLPDIHQFDNEAAFCGGRSHVRVIGQVVRLCLFCGVEPLFTPYYEPQRNYQIETFHSLWCRECWTRHEFADLRAVRDEMPRFTRWYHTRYRPPELAGRTPGQMRQGAVIHPLDAYHLALLPATRLPIMAGFVHFMRKIEPDGDVAILNERWLVDPRLPGEYVRLTIDTAQQKLSFWRQADADSPWRLLKTRVFRLKESAHERLPAFRRKAERCRDCLPV